MSAATLSNVPDSTPADGVGAFPTAMLSPGAEARIRSAEWDEAYRRLCLYLRSHGLRGDRRIQRLAGRVIDSVDASDPRWKGMHPTAMAMAAVNHAAEEWFGALAQDVALEEGGEKEINGRLAMLVLQDQVEWSDYFLHPTLPEETRAVVREKMVMRGPTFSLASMSPRPMDYGPLAMLATETPRWDWWPVIKAVFFWFCVFWVLFFAIQWGRV
ncbi:hypothetical protein DB346_04705 [Verrucomicrobia bacterium LW23]|nr:hypothetical protein DB346_04705 [Verrucomicrobia bacterium LW23]